jgi:transcriptional regulator with XRE-family HTH domain
MIREYPLADRGQHSARGRLACGAPNPVDLHVGQRLRHFRLLLGMNQEELGKAVGLTPQQVQKYECAVNRVPASLLWSFSQALNCTVSFLFEGMTPITKARSPRLLTNGEDVPALTDFRTVDRSSERQILNLTRAYHAITKDSARSMLLNLVRDLGLPDGSIHRASQRESPRRALRPVATGEALVTTLTPIPPCPGV